MLDTDLNFCLKHLLLEHISSLLPPWFDTAILPANVKETDKENSKEIVKIYFDFILNPIPHTASM